MEIFLCRKRREKEEGRRKKEEGRRKKEEGRRKKEEGKRGLGFAKHPPGLRPSPLQRGAMQNVEVKPVAPASVLLSQSSDFRPPASERR
ncbi:MAG: hypothetical protein LBB91_00435 [Clostridiales bacterium]|jgi:hypothetical protein|nr:hypothetical protein [Clostridiales bacterium]